EHGRPGQGRRAAAGGLADPLYEQDHGAGAVHRRRARPTLPDQPGPRGPGSDAAARQAVRDSDLPRRGPRLPQDREPSRRGAALGRVPGPAPGPIITNTQMESPIAPTDDHELPASTSAAQGMNPIRIAEVEALAAHLPNLYGLLVVRNGCIILEQY